MENRTVTQVKIYKLIMNMVRNRMESQTMIAVSTDLQKLKDWYKEQECPPYDEVNEIDGYSYHLLFKPGSQLQWFNPVTSLDCIDRWGYGMSSEWIDISFLSNMQLPMGCYTVTLN